MVFRVVSYTPIPVEPGYQGERIRLKVGPVSQRQPRTFVFPRLMTQPSEILVVSLPRPLGIVLEWNELGRTASVVQLLEGSAAEKKSKVRSALLADLRQDYALYSSVLSFRWRH